MVHYYLNIHVGKKLSLTNTSNHTQKLRGFQLNIKTITIKFLKKGESRGEKSLVIFA